MELSTPEFNQPIFDAAMSQVSKWDFSLTKQKLLEPAYAGWSMERTEKAEIDYKRYLALTKALGGFQPVPNGEIDRFWHEHILDTRRYFQDCHELFGGFLHHYPYFGMRGENDKEAWKSTSELSNKLWKSIFDESLYSTDSTEQKCPRACPDIRLNQKINVIQFSTIAQKCPQACPDIQPGIDHSYASQKCPQKCPDITSGIDYGYRYKQG